MKACKQTSGLVSSSCFLLSRRHSEATSALLYIGRLHSCMVVL